MNASLPRKIRLHSVANDVRASSQRLSLVPVIYSIIPVASACVPRDTPLSGRCASTCEGSLSYFSDETRY